MQVERSSRRAFLMLAIIALWAMIPVSACLRAGPAMGQHACCHGMALACDSSAMNANNSCCRVHPQSTVVALVFPDATDHLQPMAVVSHPASSAVPAITRVEGGSALAPPPSIISSAGNSILRI